MALDLCIETFGSVAPVLSADALPGFLDLRLVARRRTVRNESSTDDDLLASIMTAVDRLPFPLVHLLWLIDVCRCSYVEAADELSITAEEVGRRVALARTAIRNEIIDSHRAGDRPGCTSPPDGRYGTSS